MKELVESIARALVDHPDDVHVTVVKDRKAQCSNFESTRKISAK